MTRGHRNFLRIVTGWLRMQFPTEVDVSVRVQKIPAEGNDRYHGWYEPPQEGALSGRIVVDTDSALETAIETLCHEWAHAIVDPLGEMIDDPYGGHTDDFWVTYGRIDRAYQDACAGELCKARAKVRAAATP